MREEGSYKIGFASRIFQMTIPPGRLQMNSFCLASCSLDHIVVPDSSFTQMKLWPYESTAIQSIDRVVTLLISLQFCVNVSLDLVLC